MKGMNKEKGMIAGFAVIALAGIGSTYYLLHQGDEPAAAENKTVVVETDASGIGEVLTSREGSEAYVQTTLADADRKEYPEEESENLLAELLGFVERGEFDKITTKMTELTETYNFSTGQSNLRIADIAADATLIQTALGMTDENEAGQALTELNDPYLSAVAPLFFANKVLPYCVLDVSSLSPIVDDVTPLGTTWIADEQKQALLEDGKINAYLTAKADWIQLEGVYIYKLGLKSFEINAYVGVNADGKNELIGYYYENPDDVQYLPFQTLSFYLTEQQKLDAAIQSNWNKEE